MALSESEQAQFQEAMVSLAADHPSVRQSAMSLYAYENDLEDPTTPADSARAKTVMRTFYGLDFSDSVRALQVAAYRIYQENNAGEANNE